MGEGVLRGRRGGAGVPRSEANSAPLVAPVSGLEGCRLPAEGPGGSGRGASASTAGGGSPSDRAPGSNFRDLSSERTGGVKVAGSRGRRKPTRPTRTAHVPKTTAFYPRDLSRSNRR